MRNVTRLGGGGNDNTLDRGSIFQFSGSEECSDEVYIQNQRPLVMASSAEVVLGLPNYASLVPVVHLWTCPTSAYGLLMGLCTVCYTVLYFSFWLINILFRLGYSLFSCQSSCFKAMDLAIKKQKRILGDQVKLQSFINISRLHYRFVF